MMRVSKFDQFLLLALTIDYFTSPKRFTFSQHIHIIIKSVIYIDFLVKIMQLLTRSATNLRFAIAQTTFTAEINMESKIIRFGCNVFFNNMHYTVDASLEDHDELKKEEFPHCYCTSNNNDDSADPFFERRAWESADDIMITKNGPINLCEWKESNTEMHQPLSNNEHLRNQFVKAHLYIKDENKTESISNLREMQLEKSKKSMESHREKMMTNNLLSTSTSSPNKAKSEEGCNEEYEEEEQEEELTEGCKLTNEELHRRELEQRRKVMERNYSSYEEYVIAEFGNDNQELENRTSRREFASEPIEGDNSHNSEDENEDLLPDTDDGDNNIRLPNFLQMHTTVNSNAQIKQCRAESTTERQQSISKLETNSLTLHSEMKWKEVLLHKLGPLHGHSKLPLTDPIYWNENDVILFLHLFEQSTEQHIGNNNSADTVKVMDDEAMLQAFEIAKVNGSVLLNTVTPPTLFRIMRRWHNRRHIALEELHNLQTHSQEAENALRTTTESHLSDKIVQKHIKKLDDAVSSLTS